MDPTGNGAELAIPVAIGVGLIAYAACEGSGACDSFREGLKNVAEGADEGIRNRVDDFARGVMAKEKESSPKSDQKSRRPTKEQAEKARERSRDAAGKERCYYCGKEATREHGKSSSSEIEHKDPYSKGGKTEDKNLENSCRTCNREKGAKPEEEYRRRKGT